MYCIRNIQLRRYKHVQTIQLNIFERLMPNPKNSNYHKTLVGRLDVAEENYILREIVCILPKKDSNYALRGK